MNPGTTAAAFQVLSHMASHHHAHEHDSHHHSNDLNEHKQIVSGLNVNDIHEDEKPHSNHREVTIKERRQTTDDNESLRKSSRILVRQNSDNNEKDSDHIPDHSHDTELSQILMSTTFALNCDNFSIKLAFKTLNVYINQLSLLSFQLISFLHRPPIF